MIRSSLRSGVGLVALACVLVFPRVADACPVCFGGDGADAATFVLTTALLTFTPFLVIGAIGFWLVRRIRAAESADLADAARAAAARTAAAPAVVAGQHRDLAAPERA